MENRWGMYMWRTKIKKNKKWKKFVSCKSTSKITIFLNFFFLNGSPFGDPFWRTTRIRLIMKQLVIHFGDPWLFIMIINWRTMEIQKITDLQLENQIIQGIMVLLYGDPGLSKFSSFMDLLLEIQFIKWFSTMENHDFKFFFVFEFSILVCQLENQLNQGNCGSPLTVEIQKIRLQIYISKSRISNWRTKYFRGSM